MIHPLLLLKLTLVPSLIAIVTLAGRRWGPAVAGWLSAFPVVAAPILFFLALEHGTEFARNAAVGTLSAVLAILAFGLGYAWAATRYHWALCLLAGFLAYLAAVTGLKFWEPSLFAAIPAIIAALLAAKWLFPVPKALTPSSKLDGKPNGNDMVWRMLAGAILVFCVTHFSSQLGPRISGVLAMFPVMSSVLVVFSHRSAGAAFAIRLLRGMVLGFYAFGSFCITLSLGLQALSIGPAFLLALAAALLVQLVSRMYMMRRASI